MKQELKKRLPLGVHGAIDTLVAQGSELRFGKGEVPCVWVKQSAISHLSWKVGFQYIVFQTITKGS